MRRENSRHCGDKREKGDDRGGDDDGDERGYLNLSSFALTR
jgi:hypothetical protein